MRDIDFEVILCTCILMFLIIFCGTRAYYANREFTLREDIYDKYSNLCDNYSVNIVTTNKLNNEVSVYEKILGDNNTVRLFSKNKVETGYAYCSKKDDKEIYWLDLEYNGDNFKEYTEDFDFNVFNSTAFTSDYNLENLGITKDIKWHNAGKVRETSYYTYNSDSLGSITLHLKEETEEITRIEIDDAKEKMTIIIKSPEIIPSPMNFDDYDEVDYNTFASHLDIIKKNGLYPSGVYNMDNVNVLNIEATMK